MIPPKVFSKWLDLRAAVRHAGEIYRRHYPNPLINAGKESFEYLALSNAEHDLTVYENERCGGYPIPSDEQRRYMEQMESSPITTTIHLKRFAAKYEHKGEREMSYTPGPWRVHKTDGINKVYRIRGRDNVKVCDTLSDSREDEATAMLIASAPELLGAAKQFVRYATNGKHPYWESYLETGAGAKLLSAIAKAEGREP